MDVREKLLELLMENVENLDQAEITGESRIIEDLEMSEMDMESLLSDIEAEFEMRIPGTDFAEFVTVNDLAAYLEERLTEDVKELLD